MKTKRFFILLWVLQYLTFPEEVIQRDVLKYAEIVAVESIFVNHHTTYSSVEIALFFTAIPGPPYAFPLNFFLPNFALDRRPT